MAIRDRDVYRMLDHENVPLTFAQLEEMIRQRLLSLDTKVRLDGEGFATALRARPEFSHLLSRDDAHDLTPPESSER